MLKILLLYGRINKKEAIDIRIAICDDEPITLNLLRNLIYNEMKNNELEFEDISVYETGRSLLEEYSKLPFDVIFLDIRMPEISGFDIAERLRDISSKTFIIFITTESGLVFNAFDFQPFHFIRKLPSDQLEMQLKSVVKKLSRHIRQNDSLILDLPYNEKTSVCVRDILYISSEKNYLNYHLNDSQIRVRGKISETEDKFAVYDFVRIHNRIIVNMKNISVIDYPNYEIKLKNGEIMNIGRIYKKELHEKYTLYLRTLR